MYLCGQSMLCSAAGRDTASSVSLQQPDSSQRRAAMQNHHYFTKQRLTRVHCGLAFQERSCPVFHITSFSSKMWAGCWSARLTVWLGWEWRGDNKAGVFTASCFGCEKESTSIRLSRSMASAWSREHSRMQEDHTKEGAPLVGGHQRKRFSLSAFQERAHFPLVPLTLFLMLYSGSCPPWTSIYCLIWTKPPEAFWSDEIWSTVQFERLAAWLRLPHS